MYKPRILLADNDPEFLKSCGEFLERAKYRVTLAASLAEARQVLDNWVHLAILDLRLVRDEDEKDISGLTLARESSPEIPKIILTRYQTWEAVRLALRITDGDRPPAVDFVAKQEKLEGLLSHVREVFQNQVHIRWDLKFDWLDSDVYSLVNRFESGLEDETILSRAEELSDLFRLLFEQEDRVRIDRLVWQGGGRAALAVQTFNGGFPSQAAIVVCGLRQKVLAEREHYRDFAPEAPGDAGSALRLMAQTIHYAANLYALAGADLETVQTLAESYLAVPEKEFHAQLRLLFQETLADWRQSPPVMDEASSLAGRYRLLLEMPAALPPVAELERRIRIIALHSRAAGIDLQLDESGLAFQVGRQSHAYPPPLQALLSGAFDDPGVVLVKSPGSISGRDILVAGGDRPERAWLTDFYHAGWAPPAWDYAMLEAELRFDRLETANLQQIYAVEKALLSDDFTTPDVRDLDAPLRKPVRAILEIRKLAAEALGRDFAPYHLAIYFLALKRIEEFRPGEQTRQNERLRLAHAVVCLAMASQALAMEATVSRQPASQAPADPRPLPAQSEADMPQAGALAITIDRPNRQAWVEGQPIELGPADFELLAFLHERANILCRREDLFRHLYGRPYSKAEDYLLNTAIDRLRDKIEPDRRHPRYLMLRHGVGYILKL